MILMFFCFSAPFTKNLKCIYRKCKIFLNNSTTSFYRRNNFTLKIICEKDYCFVERKKNFFNISAIYTDFSNEVNLIQIYFSIIYIKQML